MYKIIFTCDRCLTATISVAQPNYFPEKEGWKTHNQIFAPFAGMITLSSLDRKHYCPECAEKLLNIQVFK